MTLARSKITAQGQISVPSEVRRKLGVGPGSVLEWEEGHDGIVVKRAGRYTLADVRLALFPKGEKPEAATDAQLKEGVREYMRRKHARD